MGKVRRNSVSETSRRIRRAEIPANCGRFHAIQKFAPVCSVGTTKRSDSAISLIFLDPAFFERLDFDFKNDRFGDFGLRTIRFRNYSNYCKIRRSFFTERRYERPVRTLRARNARTLVLLYMERMRLANLQIPATTSLNGNRVLGFKLDIRSRPTRPLTQLLAYTNVKCFRASAGRRPLP